MVPPNVTMTSVALGIRHLEEGPVSAALARIEYSTEERSPSDVDVITMGVRPVGKS